MKRTFSFVLISLLLTAGIFSTSVHAQPAPTPTPGPWYHQNPQQFYDRVFGTTDNPVPENEIFGERYTFAQINWIINSLSSIFGLGLTDEQSIIDFVQPFINPPPGGSGSLPTFQDFARLGPSGVLLGGIAEVYTHPPASGVNDISHSLAKLKLVSPAYAQASGAGFEFLTPFQTLWRAARDTAYFLLVILLVAAGFLIMFRVKVNPQTVVSLQLMIPKIILTLLLITFSYAIAGLVIDLMYLIIAALLTAFSTAGVFSAANLPNAIRLFTGPNNFFRIGFYFIVPLILTFLLRISLVTLGATVVLGALPGTIAAIISIIVFIAISWILFRIWWMLMRTYITLMLLIVIGPWQIMLGILPGQSGFGGWFRNLIANASVFIVVPMMFFFAMVLWSPFYAPITDFVANSDILNPLLGGLFAPLGSLSLQTTAVNPGTFPILPVVGGGGVIFSFAVGYVILSLTPRIAEIIREALKIPAFRHGNALEEPIGFVRQSWGRFVNAQSQAEQRILTEQKLQDIHREPRAFAGGLIHEIRQRTGI